jgi:hypothetical protein
MLESIEPKVNIADKSLFTSYRRGAKHDYIDHYNIKEDMFSYNVYGLSLLGNGPFVLRRISH